MYYVVKSCFITEREGNMNKIRLILYSFVLSLILPCFCMAAQEGSGGMRLTKILAVVLIIIFIVTSAIMVLFTKHLK